MRKEKGRIEILDSINFHRKQQIVDKNIIPEE